MTSNLGTEMPTRSIYRLSYEHQCNTKDRERLGGDPCARSIAFSRKVEQKVLDS